jgi:hypothetical protein
MPVGPTIRWSSRQLRHSERRRGAETDFAPEPGGARGIYSTRTDAGLVHRSGALPAVGGFLGSPADLGGNGGFTASGSTRNDIFLSVGKTIQRVG